MPVWTPIPKFSGTVSNTEGSPMGLLLLLTYASTTSSTSNIWTEISENKPEFSELFLFQDGEEYLFQDGINKQFSAISYMYSSQNKPSTSYTQINRPT